MRRCCWVAVLSNGGLTVGCFLSSGIRRLRVPFGGFRAFSPCVGVPLPSGSLVVGSGRLRWLATRRCELSTMRLGGWCRLSGFRPHPSPLVGSSPSTGCGWCCSPRWRFLVSMCGRLRRGCTEGSPFPVGSCWLRRTLGRGGGVRRSFRPPIQSRSLLRLGLWCMGGRYGVSAFGGIARERLRSESILFVSILGSVIRLSFHRVGYVVGVCASSSRGVLPGRLTVFYQLFRCGLTDLYERLLALVFSRGVCCGDVCVGWDCTM